MLGPCAVGSLRAELTPGTVAVPDQVVDRTWGRQHTVYDTTSGPVVSGCRSRSAFQMRTQCIPGPPGAPPLST